MLQTKQIKRYDKYKDSGIEWIGEIPDSWCLQRLKTVGDYRNGLTYSLEDVCEENNGTLVLRSSNIKEGKISLDDNVYVSSNIPQRLKVKKGDILICSRNGSRELIGKNAVITSDINASFGAFMMIFRCNSPKYFYYILNSHIFNYYLGSFFTSTINQLTGTNFGNMRIVYCPNIKEQEAIAEYLDRKCGEIDEVVDKQKAVIEKLKEYKQSIITEAVTKGLDKSVPLKDSGREWIGKIPEHWEIKKLKQLVSRPLQYGANESGDIYNEKFPRYIRITDIRIEDNSLKDGDKLSLEPNKAKNYILKDNDILFARSGATVGKTFLYKSEYGLSAFAGYLIRASIRENINAKFIYYYTLSSSYDEWKNRIFVQATIQNIGANKYNNIEIAIPRNKEQNIIITYLDKKCSEIDKTISEKEKLIEKLEEYKKSLIYECVTGKRKVVD